MYSVEGLLRLLNITGIGPNSIRNMIKEFGSTEGIFNASVKDLMQVPRIDEEIARDIKESRDDGFIQFQMKEIKKYDVRIITFWDDEYPFNLKQIHDPPVLLFIKGSLLYRDRFSIAIVGMRSPTEAGRMISEQFAHELSSMGITVVSGLARGIDSAAHKGAITAGGRTIAVLGSGLNRIYPPENLRLAEKVMNCGAVISEFPMGTKPDRENFPRRNRIISGLSLGTLVVEAEKRSGALITAKFANDQNREVFAIPGSLGNKKSEGTNNLIMKNWAKLVQTVDDIIVELEGQLKGMQTELEFKKPQIELSENEEKIYKVLSKKPLHIDTICDKSGINTGSALSILLILEMENLVKQLPGKMFVKY